MHRPTILGTLASRRGAANVAAWRHRLTCGHGACTDASPLAFVCRSPVGLSGAGGGAHRSASRCWWATWCCSSCASGAAAPSCRWRRWRAWRCRSRWPGFGCARCSGLADVRQPARRAARQPRLRHQDGPGGAAPASTRRRSMRAAACAARPHRRARRPRCRWGFGSPSSSAAAGSPTADARGARHATTPIPAAASGCALPLPAWAHHGWSSFDQTRPIYLEGKARKVAWRNPHVEFELELPADLKLPADLAQPRAAGADGAGRRRRSCWPRRSCPRARTSVWEIELAPLTRMEAWQVAEIKPGDRPVACSASPSPARRARRCCAPSTCASAARPTALRSSPA